MHGVAPRPAHLASPRPARLYLAGGRRQRPAATSSSVAAAVGRALQLTRCCLHDWWGLISYVGIQSLVVYKV